MKVRIAKKYVGKNNSAAIRYIKKILHKHYKGDISNARHIIRYNPFYNKTKTIYNRYLNHYFMSNKKLINKLLMEAFSFRKQEWNKLWTIEDILINKYHWPEDIIVDFDRREGYIIKCKSSPSFNNISLNDFLLNNNYE